MEKENKERRRKKKTRRKVCKKNNGRIRKCAYEKELVSRFKGNVKVMTIWLGKGRVDGAIGRQHSGQGGSRGGRGDTKGDKEGGGDRGGRVGMGGDVECIGVGEETGMEEEKRDDGIEDVT